MKILIVDEGKTRRASVARLLSEQIHKVNPENEPEKIAIREYKNGIAEAVLTDANSFNGSLSMLIERIKAENPDAKVVLIREEGDDAGSPPEASGADYVFKQAGTTAAPSPEEQSQNERLKAENSKLRNLLRSNDEQLKEDDAKLYSLQTTLGHITQTGGIGVFSAEMQNIVDLSAKYHQERDVPVFIQGETGTGKEIVARILHHGTGQASSRPFIPVNCAAISPHLFESELFGYAEGAFTGARKNGAAGKFELAQGGTLFMDEISELPKEFQPKLLRALQEREIYRIGGQQAIKLDVRFVFATNRDLRQMVEDNEFRDDLYYRLNVGLIQIPPLNKRKDEIVPLAQMFLEKYAAKRKKAFKFIDRNARKLLLEYDWPGNVRELQNTIERVVLLYNDTLLQEHHLSYLMQKNGTPPVQPADCLQLGKIKLPENRLPLEHLEQEIVGKALKKFEGNKTRVAEYLGLSRSALRSRLKKL